MNHADLRALVASPHWEWKGGMVAVAHDVDGVWTDKDGQGMRFRLGGPDESTILFEPVDLASLNTENIADEDMVAGEARIHYLPDLADDATAGAAFAVLLAAHPDEFPLMTVVTAVGSGDPWDVCFGGYEDQPQVNAEGATFGEVVARAILALPAPE